MMANELELRQMVAQLQARVEQLEDKETLLRNRVDNLEQYSRSKSLILFGALPTYVEGEEITQKVISMIASHTGVVIKGNQIEACHWLKNRKSIIIKFFSKALRNEVYRNRIPKERSGQGLFIHEHLTPLRQSLVKICAGLRKDGLLASYYTSNGRVYAKLGRESKAVEILPSMTRQDVIGALAAVPASYRDAVAAPGHWAPAVAMGQGSVQQAEEMGTQLAQSDGNKTHADVGYPVMTCEMAADEQETQLVQSGDNKARADVICPVVTCEVATDEHAPQAESSKSTRQSRSPEKKSRPNKNKKASPNNKKIKQQKQTRSATRNGNDEGTDMGGNTKTSPNTDTPSHSDTEIMSPNEVHHAGSKPGKNSKKAGKGTN